MPGIKDLQGKRLYRVMSLCCAIAFTMYGYDAGVLGGVQATKPFLDAIGNPTGKYVIPMVASSYTLAAAFCSLAVMAIGMPVGRRRCIMLGDSFVIVGAIIQASSFSVPQIIMGRIICFISCTVPTYMSEMSITEKQRGPEVGIQVIWLLHGIAFAYWLDFGFTRLSSQVSWRFPIGFQAFFALISLVGMSLLPDTPRWYYAGGREEEGDAVLARLHAKNIEHPDVQAQKLEIMRAIKLEEQNENKFRYLDLIWDRSELRAGRRIRIAYLLMVFQNMMGVNLMVYYATVILTNIGLSEFESSLLAAVMETCFALGTWPFPWTIEIFGRRKIMLWGAAASGLTMLIFIIMIGLPHQTKATQWTGVACVIAWMFIFGYSWNGAPWVYGPEIAPLKNRHLGGAAQAFGEWSFSFIMVFAGGIAIENVGWSIWIWQLVASVLVIPFIYFYCPETTGKSLEEIDLLFATDEVRERILASRIWQHPEEKLEVLEEQIENPEASKH
ncbi:putative sugar transporter STL1 [Xylogone sp. PMI_703]|nr:putative sugar transporter STL1 [Xylogone sp. PMI_703]